MADQPIETRRYRQLRRATAVAPDALIAIEQGDGPLMAVEIRQLLGRLISTDAAFEEEAEPDGIQAHLDHEENSIGLVYADPTPAKNGWYRKVGASGSGNWAQFEKLSGYAAAEVQALVAEAQAWAEAAETGAAASQGALQRYSPFAVSANAGNATGGDDAAWNRLMAGVVDVKLYGLSGSDTYRIERVRRNTSGLWGARITRASDNVIVAEASGAVVEPSDPTQPQTMYLAPSAVAGVFGFIRVRWSAFQTATFTSGWTAALGPQCIDRFNASPENTLTASAVRPGQVIMPLTAGQFAARDEAARTFSWPQLMIVDGRSNGAGRYRIAAGTVTFTNAWEVAFVDLDELASYGTAEAPNTVVKKAVYGRDLGSNGNFAARPNQLPFAWSPGAGQVDVNPLFRILGASGIVSAYDPSEIVILQGAGQIDIFKKGSNPASNRYLRYRMQRVPTPAISSDVWRWNEVWECERTGEFTFNALTRLAQGGEIEMAIRQDGKSDFMGGTAHGDEELFSATFMVDGVVKPLGGAATYRARRAEFLQGSDMYEVGTVPPKSNRVAKSYKRWIFAAEKVDVINHIVWEDDLTLAQCFMAMLTWLRVSGAVQISDKGYRAPLWAEEDISLAGFAEIGTSANIAKASGPTGYSAEVEILEGWTRPNRRFNFSPAAEYNKFYFEFCGAGYAVTTGEVMRSHARYRIDTAN